MFFATAWTSPSARKRNPRILVASVEHLEIRSLLSSAAVILWQMDPQIALDQAHGDQPDLPNTSAYVNPAGGYGLTLDASHSSGVLPTSTFTWTVTGSNGHATHRKGIHPSLSLPQGKYKVTLQATGLADTTKPVTTSTTIQVKDILIVSIGDSYASGEGNPVVPANESPDGAQWAYSPNRTMNLQNAEAHRSTISGPAEFALQLQEENPHEAVTFVSVANSGASIRQGLLGPMQSIGNPSVRLPAEIAEVKQIIGNRPINVLTLSVGANDIGFVSQVESLIENTATGSPSLAAIQSSVNSNLKTLPGLYSKLNKAIKGLDAAQVLVTDYPDLTRNQNGVVSSIPGSLGTTLISTSDAQFASNTITIPLNKAISAAAKASYWTFVDILAAFSTHGYPSTDTWIRQLGESLEMEGSVDGLFHPNAVGEQSIAGLLLAAYEGTTMMP
jgi:lysophospholipase L1-like esterase